MMKRLALLLLAMALLSGCATIELAQECRQVKQIVVKYADCPSGYASPNPSGPPICVEQSMVDEIKATCGMWF